MAITSTAEVLQETTGAHAPVKKGGITSDEENCIKNKTKQNKTKQNKTKYNLKGINIRLLIDQSDVNQQAAKPKQLCRLM